MTPLQQHVYAELRKRWPMIDPQIAVVAVHAMKAWMREEFPQSEPERKPDGVG